MVEYDAVATDWPLTSVFRKVTDEGEPGVEFLQLHHDMGGFVGIVGRGLWVDANGDLAYGFAVDGAAEETVAVRYRLVEPF